MTILAFVTTLLILRLVTGHHVFFIACPMLADVRSEKVHLLVSVSPG